MKTVVHILHEVESIFPMLIYILSLVFFFFTFSILFFNKMERFYFFQDISSSFGILNFFLSVSTAKCMVQNPLFCSLFQIYFYINKRCCFSV